MDIIKLQNIKKYYKTGNSVVKAIDDVSLNMESGKFTAVIGQSGSGKTTLLNIMGGLAKPDCGQVSVDGKDLTRMGKNELTIFRRRNIGFVFQDYNLLPALSAYENIMLPLDLDGNSLDEKYFQEIIYSLSIADILEQMPNQLSGGQQQRIAIARALIAKPAILLADEPTGNLDTRTSQDVLGLLKMTGQKFRQTIVMITHNIEIAQMADKTVRMRDGKVV
ncbi:MAG: ABC transporter ATP-binding protein [Lachnoclostridium sp.]|nr:ABC transporter ATP-binding protein [Lachnospira sp.]MCM1248376.1 ABC transporter ATP-binding protein [Lachnoclostridium sp.]